MFFSMGHGRRIVMSNQSGPPGTVTAAAATSGTGSRANIPVQTFGYLFGTAPDFPEFDDIAERLRALASAMEEPRPESDALNGTLPPIFTYLGQFIDHDISVNTDSDSEASKIGEATLARQPRNVIDANVQNGRRATLALDSLYGDLPEPDDTSLALQAAMRDGPFLREGRTVPVGVRPDLPRTGGDDLPRIGALIDAGILDPDLLPEPVRPVGPDDHRRALAFIGDGRNDENLVVAQLHLAFMRFHNAVVRQILAEARDPLSDETVFRLARRAVTWTYQWIVVNEFLPSICRRQDVDAVIRSGAPLYREFLRRLQQGDLAGLLPMPLEFSAAAFRFGHTMVRDNYDFNLNFGRPDFTTDGPGRATLRQLFAFTGRAVDQPGADPFGPFGPFEGEALPHNWLVEWERLVDSRPIFADRLARAIDTQLAPNLFDLLKEEDDDRRIFKNLALRNLRRGYNMNLPSGQSVLAGMQAAGIELGPTLSKTRLTAGPSGRALRAAGLDDHTPLWFYVLKEAEEMETGARLGTVGSHLVADTIIGLILNDPKSYWHAPGTDANGRWHPKDGVMPAGRPVAGISALLQAAGVLQRDAAVPIPGPETSGAAIPRVAIPSAAMPEAAFRLLAAPMPSMALSAPAFDPRSPDGLKITVARAFERAYGSFGIGFLQLTPKEIYRSDESAWVISFRNGVTEDLQRPYPEWAGFDDATLIGLFNATMGVVQFETVKAIGKAIDVDPFGGQ